jgi:hypothetical protein
VSTSNYDPEFGNVGGAATTVTMKSRGSAFHGSLFEYNYTNALRATQPFATTKPPFICNQFGGAFSGRIIKDKLFLFSDYQRQPTTPWKYKHSKHPHHVHARRRS